MISDRTPSPPPQQPTPARARRARAPVLARALVVLALAAGAVVLGVAPWDGAAGPPHGVAVYPLPGSRYNMPASQIAFRDVEPRRIGTVRVTGSRTGVHTGTLRDDSDGRGASFIPAKSFAAGETVTVTTHDGIVGAPGGSFRFAIKHSSKAIESAALPLVPRVPGDEQTYRSAPGITPPAVRVTRDAPSAGDDDVFVTGQSGPTQVGPMILDAKGQLVWFHPSPASGRTLFTDFRVQRYEGQPVLTWWQGIENQGSGRGVGVIMNSQYQTIATVHAADGLDADLHEFLVTPAGDAYLIAVSPVSLPGIDKPVEDSVIQEIDIQTGNVLLQWNALDHLKLSESQMSPKTPGHIFDPFHLNSVAVADNGDLVVSMRNTSAMYEIDRTTGRIVWTLGGKNSSFAMGAGTSTAFQHDVQPVGKNLFSVFDDGAGPPRLHYQSRAAVISLDLKRKTATLVHQYVHVPALSAAIEGSAQQLPSGQMFVGWGQQPAFTQFTADGRAISYDAHFIGNNISYRAYRFTWSGTPDTKPAIARSDAGDKTTVYASWNGATEVSRWRVLAGSSAGSLSPVATADTTGFETAITVPQARYVAVQALDADGQLLASSAAKRS